LWNFAVNVENMCAEAPTNRSFLTPWPFNILGLGQHWGSFGAAPGILFAESSSKLHVEMV